MKTITTQQETVITHTSYVCDIENCGFATDNSRTAKEHFAENHSFVENKKIGEQKWFRFETLENYRAFHNDGSNHYRGRILMEKHWKGPGWYYLYEWVNSYEESCETAESLASFEKEWKGKIRDLIVELRAIRQLKDPK